MFPQSCPTVLLKSWEQLWSSQGFFGFFFSLFLLDGTFLLSTALEALGTPEGPGLQWKNLILQLKAEALVKIANADAAEAAIKALEQVFSLIKMVLFYFNF